MNIVVCMKSVPETTAEKRLLPDGTLDRASVPAGDQPLGRVRHRRSPADQGERHSYGEIVLLCMGPDASTETIRKGLAMGADRAVLVADPALHGSDMWATGKVLAEALKTTQYDLIMFGSQSTDAGGGMIYNIVAEMLGLPAVTWINEIEVTGGKVRGKRGSDVGYDVVEAPCPP